MPEDAKLAPLEPEIVSPEADNAPQSVDAFSHMAVLLQQAVGSLQLQDPRAADMAARAAVALYGASEAHYSIPDRLLLRIEQYVICMFASFTRSIALQTEGRFSKARAEIQKGLTISKDAMAAIQEYVTLPEHDEEVLSIWRPLLALFPILLGAYEAYILADEFGYQGNIPRYVEQLREAVVAFRRVDELPPSANPVVLSLISMCTTNADRLETRGEVFSAKPQQRYVSPTGKKVFIIHGHDEAKWRELRDLLEDRLNLEAVVLKEETNAGETLIQKFESYAENCAYAFALFTPDDFVEKNGKKYFQARPNVMFELGWFFGHFGRDHVCIVKKADTEMPSDLAGILTVDFHREVAEGYVQIQDELKRIGII